MDVEKHVEYSAMVEEVVKKIVKPFKMFHGFLSIIFFITFVIGLSFLGFMSWSNHQVARKNSDQLELVNKFYVIQNQHTVLLKIIDENLRESNDAKLGSASMELKVQTEKMIYDIAQTKQIPLNIICGIAEVESMWNTHAVSNAGCVGLLQVTPKYGRAYLRERGIDYKQDIWFDPVTNVMCGISMLCDVQNEYVEKGIVKPDDYTFAIHSYLWGESNTNQLFGKRDQRVNVPNLAYSMRVMEAAKKYKALGL